MDNRIKLKFLTFLSTTIWNVAIKKIILNFKILFLEYKVSFFFFINSFYPCHRRDIYIIYIYKKCSYSNATLCGNFKAVGGELFEVLNKRNIYIYGNYYIRVWWVNYYFVYYNKVVDIFYWSHYYWYYFLFLLYYLSLLLLLARFFLVIFQISRIKLEMLRNFWLELFLGLRLIQLLKQFLNEPTRNRISNMYIYTSEIRLRYITVHYNIPPDYDRCIYTIYRIQLFRGIENITT